MGDTGPCGPCSEIHYDRIGDRNTLHLINKNDSNVLEIWNLVFIQYNKLSNSELKELSTKSVDTGMVLERLTSILQNKLSNYDTDIFRQILDYIHKEIGAPSYSVKVGIEDHNMIDTSYRIIADHARTLTIAISDGARPPNEKRGYVVRRILRRSIRYATQYLAAKDDLISKLVPIIAKKIRENIFKFERYG